MNVIPNFVTQLENGTPGTKLITLKSVWKQGKCTVQPVPDGRGWYLGIPRLTDEDKRKLKYWADKNARCVLMDGLTFDLSEESQRVTWGWVKHCVEIAATLEDTQSIKQAEFYIHIVEDEAAKSVAKRSLVYQAMRYINEDDERNLKDRATILGVNMQEDSTIVVMDYLMEMAQHNPQKVVDSYENKFIALKLLMLSALDKNIIKYDGSIYRHGNTVLGVSENAAFEYLKRPDNKAIVALIEREVHPEYFINSKVTRNQYDELVVENEAKELTYDESTFKTYPSISFEKQTRLTANDDSDNMQGAIDTKKVPVAREKKPVVKRSLPKKPTTKV